MLSPAEKLEKIRGLCSEGLVIDGEHHKQWHLFQIAEVVGIDIDIDEEDQGVAP